MAGLASHRSLWLAFLGLFALVVVAAVAPVEPIVVVFPFWSLLVLLACVGTLAVALLAVRWNWLGQVVES